VAVGTGISFLRDGLKIYLISRMGSINIMLDQLRRIDQRYSEVVGHELDTADGKQRVSAEMSFV
jgi:hypothetical protein